MEYTTDVQTYCKQSIIESIVNGYKKIVGIESDLSVRNEYNKCVGRVFLLNGNTKKLKLNKVVQFGPDKIKWKSNKYNGNLGFYLIDPYWVNPYRVSTKLRVPIKVLDVKSDKIITEIRELTFHQFMKSKLFDFYGGFKHKYIAAYDNFNFLLKSNKYYYAINSTIKNYKISQEDLMKVLSLIDNEKKKIKKEWGEYLRDYVEENESVRRLEEDYSVKKKVNNVIAFKR